MKKQGFTLAEVLITLGIIGVVAALTTPALVQNAGAAKVGPALEKAINTWEVANESMLNDNEASSLKSVGVVNGSEDAYISLLSNYMKMSQLNTATVSYTPTTYSGEALPTSISMEIERTDSIEMAGKSKEITLEKKISPNAALSKIALAKDGILYALNINSNFYEQMKYEKSADPNAQNKDYTSSSLGAVAQSLPNHTLGYGTVLIDINGIAEPNKLGKDVFAFQLNADGSLSAWGEKGAWNGMDNLMTDNDTCSASSVGTGATCGASILENNRKVIY